MSLRERRSRERLIVHGEGQRSLAPARRRTGMRPAPSRHVGLGTVLEPHGDSAMEPLAVGRRDEWKLSRVCQDGMTSRGEQQGPVMANTVFVNAKRALTETNMRVKDGATCPCGSTSGGSLKFGDTKPIQLDTARERQRR